VACDARKVLIVDDNVDAADMLATVLEMGGFDVRVANDGPSGLGIASTFLPDVALLDIGLPIMDGYELAKRLREEAGERGIALIAITGYGQASDRDRAHAAGFELHLVKPIDVAALAGQLDSLLASP
jgi:CheY-like chemotaxis protein